MSKKRSKGPQGTPTTKFFNKKWEEVPAKDSLYAVTIWHDAKGNFLRRRIGVRQGAAVSTASEQVEQLEEAQPGAQGTAQPSEPSEPSEPSDLPITWTHSVPDYASTFEVGPWTAIVSDPIETPPAIRLAGRYIVRGFLPSA
jgi:hypothetical protein